MPERTFILFPDGQSWDRAELRRRVIRTAKGLQDLGVRQGETVLVWLPNGPAAVEVMFAVNYLGAVCVPVGIGLRGAPLDHIVVDSGATLMVADARLLPRWQEVGHGAVATVVAVGDPPAKPVGVRLHTADAIFAATGEPASPEQPISPRDTQCVLYTSGTTGPAKGVLSSYLHRYAHAVAVPQITAEDRRLVQGPMSHTGGFGSVFGSLVTGGSVVLTEGFRTETFWETVNRFEATVTSLLGAPCCRFCSAVRLRPTTRSAPPSSRRSMPAPWSSPIASACRSTASTI
jgi:crotonobetaine/carnitine-CoA ligase